MLWLLITDIIYRQKICINKKILERAANLYVTTFTTAIISSAILGGLTFGAEDKRWGIRLTLVKLFGVQIEPIDPNHLAALAALGLILALILIFELKKSRILVNSSIILFSLIIIGSQSRSSMLGIATFVILYFWGYIRKYSLRLRLKRKVAVLFSMSLILISLGLIANIGDINGKIAKSSERFFLIADTLERLANNSFGRYDARANTTMANIEITKQVECYILACPKDHYDPHNLYIKQLKFYGMTSLITLIWMQRYIFFRGTSTAKKVFAYLFVFNKFYTSVSVWIIYASFILLLKKQKELIEKEEEI